ncbi:MAG: nucleotide exchange factor GrpE [Flavobacteriales bacterium]|nr:nucleotide exchange factor GrpE [Flavobacteriales bacterium]
MRGIMEEKEPMNDMDGQSGESTGTDAVDQQEKGDAGIAEGREDTDNLVSKHADEIQALNDKYLRLYSEFENFRKRTQKERADLIRTAGEDIFTALLPVLDDFERALQSMMNAEDVKSLKEGVELIHHKLKNTLESRGLRALESKGESFDVEKHEAISQLPAPEKKLKGKVIEEVEKGYTLHDKVIRYAKVIIGQ